MTEATTDRIPQQKPNRKISVETDLSFKNPNNEVIQRRLNNRRYNVHNPDESNGVLNNLGHDTETQIEKAEHIQSGLVLGQVEKLVIRCDRYNPARGAAVIPLPDWVANKKGMYKIQYEDDLCFEYSVQCGFSEIYKKDPPCDMHHYKKVCGRQVHQMAQYCLSSW